MAKRRISKKALRALIVDSLKKRGYRIRQGKIEMPPLSNKEAIRKANVHAVNYRIANVRKRIGDDETHFIKDFAWGKEIRAEKISPYLVEVTSQSEEDFLFRYACCHWSIPVSSGYGRRMRFLIKDRQNGKLMGILGLSDPIFSLSPRDNWVDWNFKTRADNLRHVMEAFVLGAVPPYSWLLCGKFVAMAAASSDIQKAFKRKYRNTVGAIRRRVFDGRLALITTMSAFGRSSIYNRLICPGRKLYESVGYTEGSGDFHFSDEIYQTIFDWTVDFLKPRESRWKTGFRNRREIINACLKALSLPQSLRYHGIRREIFVAPLARNSAEFLRGENKKLATYSESMADLFAFFRQRWLLPRAERDPRYQYFNPNSLRLWGGQASA